MTNLSCFEHCRTYSIEVKVETFGVFNSRAENNTSLPAKADIIDKPIHQMADVPIFTSYPLPSLALLFSDISPTSCYRFPY